MLTIGSLCSGACDGLSLGMEWAGIGPVIWQVENDEERRTNLARHWPSASREPSDVREAGATNLAPVELIVTSSPCKDLSSAGKRAGLEGDQSRLWYECERIIGELMPPWVVVENVASGAGDWVPYVRFGLERYGYVTLPVPLAAGDCNAPQERKRVFVVANLDHPKQFAQPQHGEMGRPSPPLGNPAGELTQERGGRFVGWCPAAGETGANSSRRHQGWPTELEVVSRIHGVPAWVVSALGDSVVPQCAEVIGWVIRELMSEGED